MRHPEGWYEANDAYLGAALGWLRLRLERLIPAPPHPASEPAPRPGSAGSCTCRPGEAPLTSPPPRPGRDVA